MKLAYLASVLAVGIGAAAANAQQPPQYAPNGQPPQQQFAPGVNGQPYCREFTQKIIIGGAPHTGYGISCMQPDGSWQVVSQPQDNSAPPPPAPYAQAAAYPPGSYPAGYGYVVAPPPAYYAAPYPYYYGPSVGLNFDIGRGGYYHDHGWRR
jgi:hypothetical protein